MKIDTSGVSVAPVKAKIKKPEAGDKTCGLGAVIRHMREIKNRTQAEVAAAIGLERTSIVNIEKGTQTLSIAHLQMNESSHPEEAIQARSTIVTPAW